MRILLAFLPLEAMALGCSSLKNRLTLANTIIYESSYTAAITTIITLGVCQVITTSTAVDATVNTSAFDRLVRT
ncbi:hypothetical protein BDZ89DRAFT_1072577 [Hymenopellis radicata]|nr:hypothetical protein BDZ89DRAFT_1072577 [Hymenopellis radicata]